ncbi:zf-HC2 domain-containing protein [Candidatus Bathyarchaeota archaeon]|nr:zf-HC2 domain-containing protein [Candidatus Bathyarchaeota archaeon]
MKCSKTKLILSEYIDETLDANIRSLVEKHLLGCEKCKADYASLKNLISELGELPRVKAPDDFLKNLHSRMEPRFGLKKIVQTLFIPFKIKIPLELLTATAAAVLIIFFINIQQHEKPLTDLLYSQKTERLDDTSMPADKFGAAATRQPAEDKSILKRKSSDAPQLKEKQPRKESPKIAASKEAREKSSALYESTPAPAAEEMQAAYRGKKEEEEVKKPIELALLLDYAASSKPYTAMANIDKPDQTFSDMESEPALKKQISVGESDTTDSKARLKSGSTDEEKVGAPESQEGMLLESEPEKALLKSTDERIRSIIKTNSGKVISVKYDEQTHLPVSILADIPSSKFKSFYSQLNEIGRLKQPLPVIDEASNEPLRVNILLISSP